MDYIQFQQDDTQASARAQNGNRQIQATQADVSLGVEDPSSMNLEFISQLSAFTDNALKAIERMSAIAEKGPSYLLLALGSFILITTIGFQSPIFSGLHLTLQPVDFIALLILGVVLLLAGSYLRIFQFRAELEVHKELHQDERLAQKALIKRQMLALKHEHRLREIAQPNYKGLLIKPIQQQETVSSHNDLKVDDQGNRKSRGTADPEHKSHIVL